MSMDGTVSIGLVSQAVEGLKGIGAIDVAVGSPTVWVAIGGKQEYAGYVEFDVENDGVTTTACPEDLSGGYTSAAEDWPKRKNEITARFNQHRNRENAMKELREQAETLGFELVPKKE